MSEYHRHMRHTISDIIADHGGDPDACRVTGVRYESGELIVETRSVDSDARLRAVAAAAIAGHRKGGGFVEVVVDGHRAAYFSEGGDPVVEVDRVDGEHVTRHEFDVNDEMLDLLVAASEVDLE